MLRFLDAGETHGKALVAIIEGLPANLSIDTDKINEMLKKRQGGYGRGGRMKIETDTVEILSGVRGKKTLGSPVALMIKNKDYQNWENIMSPEFSNGERAVYVARPGHADLTGALKYDHEDMRNVLERASARETAIRTAVGAVCKQLLSELGISVMSRVVSIGDVADASVVNYDNYENNISSNELRMYDAALVDEAKKLIDKAKQEGESLGGVVEVVALGVPAGLGSYVQFDKKIDARIGGAIMSVQAIKGVEFGIGFEASKRFGSKVHDEILYSDGYKRRTNNAGGIEGGMTNGEPVVMRAAMKPIPTLYTPLKSVNIKDKSVADASVERSDICAVSACSVVCEAVLAFELASAVCEKFCSDNMGELAKSVDDYKKRIAQK
ncbi:MAG: chorismate synthase [Ruminococcaceae bacterium]|nr:chorismate synthase [Oscillospiraceae bacterium]